MTSIILFFYIISISIILITEYSLLCCNFRVLLHVFVLCYTYVFSSLFILFKLQNYTVTLLLFHVLCMPGVGAHLLFLGK